IAPYGEPVVRVAFAASEYVFVVDAFGSLLWQRQAPHPQQCYFGRFVADATRPQLFVHNKRERLQLYDFDGEHLWDVWPEEHWPLGKPAAVNRKFHLAI